MKLTLKSDGCVLVARNKKEYDRNGQKGCVYTLGVVCNGQVAEVNCTDIAYDKAGEVGQYSEVIMCGEYDTNYKNFRVTAVGPVIKK